jgi:hypothetical protein
MNPYRILFPRHQRRFPGMRWVNIVLRTLHLIGIAGIGGAYLYPAETAAWVPYLWLTLLSGFAMVAVSCYGNGVWLLQLRGLLIMGKLLVLLLLAWLPQLSPQGVIAVVALSSVIAHAPGSLRYYSPWHRRRIEHL